MFDILLTTGYFLLEVLLHADLIIAHHDAKFRFLVFYCGARLELEGLDEAFFEAELSGDCSVFSDQMFHLFVKFYVLVFDFLVLVV